MPPFRQHEYLAAQADDGEASRQRRQVVRGLKWQAILSLHTKGPHCRGPFFMPPRSRLIVLPDAKGGARPVFGKINR
jgi:hypothetical protein